MRPGLNQTRPKLFGGNDPEVFGGQVEPTPLRNKEAYACIATYRATYGITNGAPARATQPCPSLAEYNEGRTTPPPPPRVRMTVIRMRMMRMSGLTLADDDQDEDEENEGNDQEENEEDEWYL